MANNYTFLDATGATQTAASSVVAGAQQPLVQISSMPAITFTGSPSISGAVTIVGNPSISGTVNLGPTSVTTLQGTNPWIAQIISSVNSTGYLLRNDTVASALGVDLTYRTLMGDSAGRVVIKPFAPNESSIWGSNSTNNAGDVASVMAIPAAGAGLRNYITDIMIANTGSVATLITFTEGGASVLGRTIAPATGGSNIIHMASPMRNQTANQPINVVVGTASSTVYFTLTGHKAP